MGKDGRYVDGFVVPVPKAKLDGYRKMAETAGKIWMELGALEYVEAVADDVKPGKLTSFPQSVMLEPDEVVIFAWIVYRSREDRDRIVAQVMKDERLEAYSGAVPFDGKRMIFGGFAKLVEM